MTATLRTTTARTLLATLALAGAALTVQAQQPAASASDARPNAEQRAEQRADRMAQRQQWRAERHAKRMADLKAQLRLTAAQEGAWTQFTQAMQPPARAGGPGMGMGMNRAEFDKLTTPQRIDRMQQMADQRHTEMKQRGDAVKAFYAQLTPEQQKTFDQAHRFGPGGGKAQRGGPGFGPGFGPGGR